MHKTNAQWEAGAIPSPELIARVGALIGELRGRSASTAARDCAPARRACGSVRRRRARRSRRARSPASNELPAGFSILRTRRSTRRSSGPRARPRVLGDGEMDIRPVTEPWDIGIAPKPADVDTRRYMVLRKATAATEAGVELPARGAHRFRA